MESISFKHGRKGSLIPPRRIGGGLFWCLKVNGKGDELNDTNIIAGKDPAREKRVPGDAGSVSDVLRCVYNVFIAV